MGQRAQNLEKARIILAEIAGIESVVISQRTQDNQYNTDLILGIGSHQETEWETIFINVQNISSEQISLFNRRKVDVIGSPAIHEVQPGIARLYFSFKS